MLGERRETIDVRRPECFEERLEFPQLLLVGAVEPPFSVPPDGYEARLAKQREMLGDAGVAELESLDELADRQLKQLLESRPV